VKDVSDPNNRNRPAGRPLLRYRDMQEFQRSKERPYIHLVDGGVSDNLGMRAILEGLEELEASPAFRAQTQLQSLRRLVVIVVNSRSSPDTDWDKGESAPGVFNQLLQSSSVPIDRYSYESVELLKDMVHGWHVKQELAIAQARLQGQSEAEAKASVPDISVFAIDVSFDSIEDPKERSYFMNLPTSFYLPPQDVDRLRAVAGELLRQSGDYQRLLKELGATPGG
jgi:NTE family protein